MNTSQGGPNAKVDGFASENANRTKAKTCIVTNCGIIFTSVQCEQTLEAYSYLRKANAQAMLLSNGWEISNAVQIKLQPRHRKKFRFRVCFH